MIMKVTGGSNGEKNATNPKTGPYASVESQTTLNQYAITNGTTK